MLRVGLTGGMACGKSTVAEMFARLGARVAYADKIAHELMQPGQAVYNNIVAAFGREILAADGSIDRVRLAQAAFAEVAPGSSPAGPSRVSELNAIVHPAVIRRQEEWMDEVGRHDLKAVAIVEAALIFEAGVGKRFDKVVVVACDPEQKIGRFAKRAGLPLEGARREIERRSAAQWPDEEKIRRADYVIQNSGTIEDTERQVERIFAELKRESERS